MFWVRTIALWIIGAIVGWIIGMTLTRVTFTFDNWRLERKMSHQQKRFNAPFAR